MASEQSAIVFVPNRWYSSVCSLLTDAGLINQGEIAGGAIQIKTNERQPTIAVEETALCCTRYSIISWETTGTLGSVVVQPLHRGVFEPRTWSARGSVVVGEGDILGCSQELLVGYGEAQPKFGGESAVDECVPVLEEDCEIHAVEA